MNLTLVVSAGILLFFVGLLVFFVRRTRRVPHHSRRKDRLEIRDSEN